METVVLESTNTINSDCFMPARSMDEEREKAHLYLGDLTFGIGWSERPNLVTPPWLIQYLIAFYGCRREVGSLSCCLSSKFFDSSDKCPYVFCGHMGRHSSPAGNDYARAVFERVDQFINRPPNVRGLSFRQDRKST